MKSILLATLLLSSVYAGEKVFQHEMFFIGDDGKTGLELLQIENPKRIKTELKNSYDNHLFLNADNIIKKGEGNYIIDSRDTTIFQKINLESYETELSKKEKGKTRTYLFRGINNSSVENYETRSVVTVVIPKSLKIKSFRPVKIIGSKIIEDKRSASISRTDYSITAESPSASNYGVEVVVENITSSNEIFEDVKSSLDKYEISVSQDGKNTKIILPVDNLFDSGSSEMKEEGKKWLLSFVSSIKDKNYEEIKIEGHTDSSPISTVKYPSNWELSSARAIESLKFLVQNGLDESKLSATGYSSTKPLSEDKTKNRRIEITIIGSVS